MQAKYSNWQVHGQEQKQKLWEEQPEDSCDYLQFCHDAGLRIWHRDEDREQRKRQSSDTDLCSISKCFSTLALWILHGKGWCSKNSAGSTKYPYTKNFSAYVYLQNNQTDHRPQCKMCINTTTGTQESTVTMC